MRGSLNYLKPLIYCIAFVLQPWIGKTKGCQNIPKKGGAILIANHASYLDHFFIGAQIVRRSKRVPKFLAKKEHFDTPLQRWWHTYIGAVPIDRESGGKEALAAAEAYLREGGLIMIYPEGTRTLTGKMNRAKTGAVRLALQAQVPVIPMGLTNTFFILPKGKRIPRMKKADLYIGKPVSLSAYYKKRATKKVLRDVTTMLMRKVAVLAKMRYEFTK